MSALEVVAPGPLTTVQDGGRRGLAALGVSPSGACDRRSFRLGNRLVANDEEAPALEVTFGGLAFRVDGGDVVLATTGARCPATIEGSRGARDLAHDAVSWVPDGATVRLGQPETGLRTYVAVRGGLAVAPVADPEVGELELRVLLGPRDDWLSDAGRHALVHRRFTVSSESNRTGIRLEGEPLERARAEELPSEGMVRGAIQVPPSGLPVLFLADHPVTGGYPVAAYVHDEDVDVAAQARPGQALRFRRASR